MKRVKLNKEQKNIVAISLVNIAVAGFVLGVLTPLFTKSNSERYIASFVFGIAVYLSFLSVAIWIMKK